MSDSPDPGPRARSPWTLRVVVLVAVVIFAVVVWLVVRDGGAPAASPSPAASSPTAPSPTATQDPAEPTPSTTGAAGCDATDDDTPEGADTHEVVDVDGDGEADTAWLTGSADRRFGITTASGATFSVAIDAASPQRAAAVVNVVAAGDDSSPIALIDTGREVLLLSAADCDLAATQNLAGDAYTFDKGFTGHGTGVGCTEADGALRLAGLDATTAGDGSFTVDRTFVDLDDGAVTGSNGEEQTVAQGAGPADPVVVTAQGTSCGELVAGEDGPVEPQS
ncbi:hypothetical protein [Krasilnikoviella flava]|uniref:Uncharacterized protein n=1 Tax=Krasilnikoviella flava TaxID=526729 RepID=A0A1T5K986_9MICO|nr:hypothetical protein [Krasilnikoviella flava]SKC60257.1 hypothetical protein SAMN04324258_1956 [Krasilnikoviella flava]